MSGFVLIIVQVKAELEETKEQCEGLKNDLGSVTADLEAKIASITEREEELQILRSCLSQVTEQAAATADDVVDGGASPSPGGETAGEEGEDVGERKQMQLEKIQAMLNTTKVNRFADPLPNICWFQIHIFNPHLGSARTP